MHDHTSAPGSILPLLAVAPLVLLAAVYWVGVASERRRGTRSWPARRVWCWMLGLGVAASALIGPLADHAHDDFVAHMAAHVLIGMVAPTFLVLGAPITLALRTMDPLVARRLTRVLKSRPIRFVNHSVTAGVLNVGSMYVLYRTPLHELMLGNVLLHYIVLVHFLAAGTLFTNAIIGIDPNPHRASRPARAVVLVLSAAAHAALAKMLYATPPTGVPVVEAQAGAQLMYHAGDAAELLMMVIFCLGWYRDAGRRRGAYVAPTSSASRTAAWTPSRHGSP